LAFKHYAPKTLDNQKVCLVGFFTMGLLYWAGAILAKLQIVASSKRLRQLLYYLLKNSRKIFDREETELELERSPAKQI